MSNKTPTCHFDQSAATWDAEPRHAHQAKAVGEAILRQVRPTRDMDVLDYGCGTGLLGLFLLPHVQSVTGADNSPGMLKVLEEKIRSGGARGMQAAKLDLPRDPVPESRYHLIAANMVLHHVEETDALLSTFHRMLLPDGALAIADLDSEPGLFHRTESAESVYHLGFDRDALKDRFLQAGFADVTDTTAHVIRKTGADETIREFPVFLIVGRRG